jgi:uncharacterized protein (TIGR03084 family)
MDVVAVVADLTDESCSLDAIVAALADGDWRRNTPAAGWTIAHQIAHLAWTDRATLVAINDPEQFAAHVARAFAAPATFVDEGAEQTLAAPAALLETWRAGRAELARALVGVPAGQKIPWYGLSMSPTSMATARIMETWAHGLDVADALGITPEPTDRLRHIAFLGHRTLAYSFLANGRPSPTEPVRLELTGPAPAPDGAQPQWTFGPEQASNRVSGPALDFCLLVTQRRNRADLDLTAQGPVADEWLGIAQCFAGPPGGGRPRTGGSR